jgi:sulfatase maturation enzyme AslB (radical SAM superfamily)
MYANSSTLKLKTLYNVLKQLLKINRNETKIMLTFIGGEPLLNFGIIPDVYKLLDKEYPELSKIPTLIETNLTFLPNGFIEYVKINNVQIMVALNSQKYSKPYSNGRDSRPDVLKNIARLKKYGLSPIINSTLTTDYSFLELCWLCQYVVDNNFRWNLNPEILFSGDIETTYNNIIYVYNVLKEKGYNLENFRFCKRDFYPPRLIIGIDYMGKVYDACPLYSRYYGVIYDFIPEFKKAIKRYNDAIVTYDVPDECKLCKFHKQCILSRCNAITKNDKISITNFKNYKTACALNKKVYLYLESQKKE